MIGNTGVSLWQLNFYEHVIRDNRELECLREYIQANPHRWTEDEETIA